MKPKKRQAATRIKELALKIEAEVDDSHGSHKDVLSAIRVFAQEIWFIADRADARTGRLDPKHRRKPRKR